MRSIKIVRDASRAMAAHGSRRFSQARDQTTKPLAIPDFKLSGGALGIDGTRLPGRSPGPPPEKLRRVARLPERLESDHVELDGNRSGITIDVATEFTSPISDAEHQTVTPVEPDSPQTVAEILKARKKELFKKHVAGKEERNEKGRLQTRIPLIDPYEASNGFPGDLVVKGKKGSAAPYFGDGKKKGLLDHVGQGEGSTFIEALKAGIVTKSFSDDTAKELYAITLLEGMRIQHSYVRFAEALELARSDGDFIERFKKIPYTRRGGAKAMREKRVHDEGEETDSEEEDGWYKIFTAKKKQLDEAKERKSMG